MSDTVTESSSSRPAHVSFNFTSDLKNSYSVSCKWKIVGFKRFFDILTDGHLSKIICRFTGYVYENSVPFPITWKLRFAPRFCGNPGLSLKRKSGEDIEQVSVLASLVILNSENEIVFSDDARYGSLEVGEVIFWKLGENWEDFFSKISDGPLTVKCTVEPMTWNSVTSNCTFLPTPAEQAHVESLVADFKRLLDSGDNADVTFQLPDGTLIPAHKGVLSARSPVFKTMFSTDMKEANDNIVQLVDIGQESLKVLLSYIYTGAMSLKGKSSQCLMEIVNAADKYQLDKMKKLCDSQLSECCDYTNAVDLLKLANRHGLQTAEARISEYIKMNMDNVLSILKSTN